MKKKKKIVFQSVSESFCLSCYKQKNLKKLQNINPREAAGVTIIQFTKIIKTSSDQRGFSLTDARNASVESIDYKVIPRNAKIVSVVLIISVILKQNGKFNDCSVGILNREIMCYTYICTRRKHQKTKCFLMSLHCVKKSIFEVFLVRIQCECGKIRARKTPKTDTFYAVSGGIERDQQHEMSLFFQPLFQPYENHYSYKHAGFFGQLLGCPEDGSVTRYSLLNRSLMEVS